MLALSSTELHLLQEDGRSRTSDFQLVIDNRCLFGPLAVYAPCQRLLQSSAGM